MRVTYRTQDTHTYWTNRWDAITPDNEMTNPAAYPLKYSNIAIKANRGYVLEAGCGGGRLLRYYHNRGYEIIGIDFVPNVIKQLKQVDASLKVAVADINNLSFHDSMFDCVLAFGVFHNLEDNLMHAIEEARRIMKPGAVICASFRADNINNRLTDWLWRRRYEGDKSNFDIFHKINLTESEVISLFDSCGFHVERILPVENMPLLYRAPIFREKKHKAFNENIGRSEGYRLSGVGRVIQDFLMWLCPTCFCSLFVLFARK